MESMATAGANYDNHRVSPLPRAGALLIAILVTAAGVAPLFGSEESTRLIVPPHSLERPAGTGAKAEATIPVLNGFQIEPTVEQQAPDTVPSATGPVVSPETASPATPRA